MEEKRPRTPTAFQKAMKWLKPIYIAAALFFLARYLFQNYEAIRALQISLDWPVLALSMVTYLLYKLTLAWLFHYITRLDRCDIPVREALPAYLYSVLGKYIPGKVFMLAARFPSYQRHQKRFSDVSVCFLIENGCTLLGAAFLFLLSLLFFPNDLLAQYQLVVMAFIALFFICLNPKIINWVLHWFGRLFKRTNDVSIPITYPQMIKLVMLFIVNWLIVGTGFYVLIRSIYPIPLSQMLYAGGVFALSSIIGILAFFAPSGIGVREGIMILGLSFIMPQEYAVIISVVSRLWATVSELLLIGCAAIFIRARKSKT